MFASVTNIYFFYFLRAANHEHYTNATLWAILIQLGRYLMGIYEIQKSAVLTPKEPLLGMEALLLASVPHPTARNKQF